MMRMLFTNLINNAFKEKNEKKLKQLYTFILKKKESTHISEDDVVYHISSISSNLNKLECTFRWVSSFHMYSTPRSNRGTSSHSSIQESYNGNEDISMEILPNTAAEKCTLRRSKLVRATDSVRSTDECSKRDDQVLLSLHKFVFISKVQLNAFFSAYLKHIFLKKKSNNINIKNWAYLLNSLCLMNYEEHGKNCKYIFEKIIKEVILKQQEYINFAKEENIYISSQKKDNSCFTPQANINSQTIVELLTVTNKHIEKLVKWNINILLFNLFCLSTINYLLCSTIFTIGNEIIKASITYTPINKKSKCEISIQTNMPINTNREHMNKLIIFYDHICLDVHNFVSITLFLTTYKQFYNSFSYTIDISYNKNKNERKRCKHNYIISEIQKTLIRIYFCIFQIPNLVEEKIRYGPFVNEHKVKTSKINFDKMGFTYTREGCKNRNTEYPNGRCKSMMRDTQVTHASHVRHVDRVDHVDYIKYLDADYNYGAFFYTQLLYPPHFPSNNCATTKIWSFFYKEAQSAFKEEEGGLIMNRIIFQNSIMLIKFLNMITSLSEPTDMHYLNYFNKCIYNHIYFFKFLIQLEKECTHYSHVQAIYVYIHFFKFILNFYISIVCTNNFTYLLSSFCYYYEGNQTHEQKKDILNVVSIINREIGRRVYAALCSSAHSRIQSEVTRESSSVLFAGSNSILFAGSSNNCATSMIRMSINGRHLCNMCNMYTKLNIYEINFISSVIKYIYEYLPKLNSQDVTAFVSFLSKAHYENKEILQHVMHYIKKYIDRYSFCEIHLIIRSYYILNALSEESIHHILSHLLTRVLHINHITVLNGGGIRQRCISDRVKYNNTDKQVAYMLDKFTKMANRLVMKSEKRYFYNPQEEEITQDTEFSKILIIKEKKFYASLNKHISNNTFQSKKYVQAMVNILSIFSKVKIKKKNLILLCDAIYIFIVRHEQYNKLLNIHDWVSLILSYCRVKYNSVYLYKSVQLLYNKMMHVYKTDKQLSKKDKSLLLSLCYDLKKCKIENYSLLLTFLADKKKKKN
ncbi:hypothetical protein MKS88_002113 [Plasmodium brasilianum]|uniref:Uncharacterized protein n=1 Tax=Plasmodium brasilianum TaxID=5824 RepID=A0ACB9YD71_PLABR|nr:hypothetical protein MKS88_002113 [Plasmodium brasilianum]